MKPRVSKPALLPTLLVAACASRTYAQSPPTSNPSWTIDTVTVTAQRLSDATPDATTATKTPTSLLDTPQSIQVVDRTLIEEQDRRTLADALVNVSGVTPAKTEETVLAQPIVRGFAAEIYVDGLPAYGGTAVVDPASLVNVERIEVAKGPTATLYGGGIGAPLGGLINLVSKKPLTNFSADVAVRGGSYGTVDPYFDLNLPLTDDGRILSRVTGEYQKADSYIAKLTSDHLAINPTIAFAFGERTELTLRGQYSRINQLEYSGLPTAITVDGPTLADPDHFSGAGDAPETTIENRLITLQLDHRFSDAVSTRITGRYYASDFDEYGSFVFPAFYPPSPATPTQYPLVTGYLPTTVREYTVDANLIAAASGLGLKHEFLLGLTADRTRYDAAMGLNLFPIGTIDYANPAADVPFGPVPAVSFFQQDHYRNLATYFQDQITFADRVHVVAAARYTRLTIEQADNDLDQAYSKVTPRVGATVDIAHGIALFAGYSEGFRGTLNIVSAGVPVPETSESKEGGLKVSLGNLGLSGTLAGFDLRRQKVPTPDPENPFVDIQTGEQRARGLEADVVFEPVPAISFLADYAHTDAVVTADAVIPIGNELPRVPRDSGRLAGRYRVQGGVLAGFAVGGGLTSVSRRQATLPNMDTVPGYTVFDAQAAYSLERWTLTVAIANLTGIRAYDPYQYLGQSQVIPIPARSVFVTLRGHF